MDFIRSLDGGDEPPSGSMVDSTAPPSTAAGVDSFAASLLQYRASHHPSSASSSRAATFRHRPIKHRPSTFHDVQFDSDKESDDGADDGPGGATGDVPDFDAELLVRRALARGEPEFVGSSKRAEASTLEAFKRRTDDDISSMDTGDYFRSHESDSIPIDSGLHSRLGPTSRMNVDPIPLPRSTFHTLDGYKTRDLFTSQAIRTKTTRAQVVHASAHHPDGYRYRTSADHTLGQSDFPKTRIQDHGYRAGPDADLNSQAHPDVQLGLHKLRPTLDEKKVEDQIAALNTQHAQRRLSQQKLMNDVSNKVKEFTRLQERRDEETIRRQEDAYRQLFERQEAELRTKELAKKLRPVSAPIRQTITRKHKHQESQSSTHSSKSINVNEEDEYESDSPPSPSETQEDRDRRDTRTAISHPDVQILQQQAAAIAAAADLDRPAGFTVRPSTAGRLRMNRWAEEANRPSSNNTPNDESDPTHIHDATCAHGHSHSRSHGSFSSHIHSRSHATLPSSSPSTATELLHRHRPGSASLAAYRPATSTAPTTAPPGASASATASAAAAAATRLNEPLGGVPVPLIEGHFKQEAWSMARREEYEIDSLTREMGELAPPTSVVSDEDDEVVFEDSIAGASAARIKHELRKAEKARLAQEAREHAKAQRAEAREKLRFKTEIWTPDRLGIIQFGETEKDHTISSIKSKQLQLTKAGIPLSKPSTHDVAFNSSVVKRKIVPPPKVRITKDSSSNETKDSTTTKAETTKKTTTTFGKKGPPVVKGRPAPVSATLAKAQALQRNQASSDFVTGLYTNGGILADAVEQMTQPPPLGKASSSLYRADQDPLTRRKSGSIRPFSATPAVGGRMALVPAGGTADDLLRSLDPNVANLTNPISSMRPATATLIGESASHPHLLKTAKSKATTISNLLSQVHSHVQHQEGLSTVERVKESLASSPEPIRISRSILERSLLAPHVILTPQQRGEYPTQIANLPVNPFFDGKKKKKKSKGRKGGSSKKKKKGSSKKKKSGVSSKVVEPEGLSFPLGTSPSEFAGNPLVSDLPLINLSDLLEHSEDKASFRNVFLKHATHLMLVFDFYSQRNSNGGGPPLMTQMKWLQFLHIIGIFQTNTSSPQTPPVTIRHALEIFADDEDLSVENMDVDELLSRPAFLERLARIAVLKCGTLKPLPPAPLGETQPQQPIPMGPVEALETLIVKFVLPNALSLSSSDFRLRLLSDKVQSVFQLNNIPLQTMFSHSADSHEGTISYENWKILLKDCDISPISGYVEKSLRDTCEGTDVKEVKHLRIFYPDLLELFGRMSDLATPSNDLSVGLAAFLHNAWASFTKRVPSALEVATAIAASHQAAANNAMGTGSKTTTPRDTRVKFA